MNICFISKYPPIEGGVSSQTYWLAKELGKKGHNIHIVTNSWCVESFFRENFLAEDLNYYQPKNVKVHNIEPLRRIVSIPSYEKYTEEMANLALQVIKMYEIDLIDSYYFFPYVISGFIAKILSEKPQIIRHAGSDLNITFLGNQRMFYVLISEILKKADGIITRSSLSGFFLELGIPPKKLFFSNPSVNTRVFNPKVKPINLEKFCTKITRPIIAYIGKTSKEKGILELIEAVKNINKKFTLLLITNGRDFERVKNLVKRYRVKNIVFSNFVAPWRMPSLLKTIDCLVMLENNFPVRWHFPMLPREAWAVSKCTLLSGELYNKYRCFGIEENTHTLVINNPNDIKRLQEKIEWIIENIDKVNQIGKKARKLSMKIEKWEEYVKTIEKIYGRIYANSEKTKC